MTKEPFWPWDEGYGDIPDDDYDDAAEWHDRQHPVWNEGCGDCVERAERIEAER